MSEMTPEGFKAWRERMGWSQQQASDQLGKQVLQIKRYERPAPPGGDAPHPIPRSTALACAALEAGLTAE